MVVPRTSSRLATSLLHTSGRGVRAATRTRAIGSALVTIPSVGYLIQPQLNKGQSHGHGEGEHSEHSEKEGGEGAGEDQEKSEEDGESEREREVASDGEAWGDEESGVSQGTGSAADDQPRPDHSVQDAGQGSPETSGGEDPKAGAYEVESGSNVEGVQFKGATSGGTREGEQGDTRKHIPDAKGFNKKRIESHYAKEQGQLDGEDSSGTDKAAASKPPSGPNTMSQKQEGLSNTSTKHSTDMDNNPDKSKKGEGMVETAKLKGSVDPGRPQAENRPGKEDATGSQADT
ncbi:MAG: hypothetical protein Q9182_004037 [Xanthomendoza sp. 2 TL-2023]